MPANIAPETLHKLLRYEPETGKLFWRERSVDLFNDGFRAASHNCVLWNSKFSGKEALNSTRSKGYLHGSILGGNYRAHRVIWAMAHGKWPADQIDHINGDPADNRLENLREVSNAENGRNQKRSSNNASGTTGVHWVEQRGKWRAQIGYGGKILHLGYFTEREEAAKARKDAEAEYGYHENHGRKPSESTK